jgi:hypothetical protein
LINYLLSIGLGREGASISVSFAESGGAEDTIAEEEGNGEDDEDRAMMDDA